MPPIFPRTRWAATARRKRPLCHGQTAAHLWRPFCHGICIMWGGPAAPAALLPNIFWNAMSTVWRNASLFSHLQTSRQSFLSPFCVTLWHVTVSKWADGLLSKVALTIRTGKGGHGPDVVMVRRTVISKKKNVWDFSDISFRAYSWTGVLTFDTIVRLSRLAYFHVVQFLVFF